MREWQEVRLKDLGQIQSGFAFKSKDWVESGIPVVKIQDVRGGRVNVDGSSYVSSETACSAERYRLRFGDVLLTMSGEIGAVGIFRSHKHALLNQRVGRLRISDGDPLLQRYVGYALQNPDLKKAMENVAYGVAQPNISPALLGDLPIWLPPVEDLQAVVLLLDCLDGLIENNRRRIELLEEMARSIYREWFVHFRFPGHETATFVESPLGLIPEGWKVEMLGNVMSLNYGKALKKADRLGGSSAVVGSSGIVGWHDESIVSGPVIVVGRKGNVGSVFWIDADAWPIDTTYFVTTELPHRYVFEHLRSIEFLNTHAAVPGLSRDNAYRREFLVPQQDIVLRFERAAEALMFEASVLESQSTRLTRIRDLLLPKLVTGQIDVSQLDLSDLLKEPVG